MLNRYLVAHEDSITMWDPVFVTSASPADAVKKYLKQVYSKDETFREYVQDLHDIEAFVGGLVYATEEEILSFASGILDEAPEKVRRRVQEFFSENPVLGAVFLQYVETEDVKVIDDAIYEYIAERDPDGIVAIETAKIQCLT